MAAIEEPTGIMTVLARGKGWKWLLIACLGGLFLVTEAFAHGSTPRFLSPDRDAIVSENIKVHIQKVHRKKFPYVHTSVRNASTSVEKWSGLIPLSSVGYEQTIDVTGWEPGRYVIETKFLGDIVEHTQKRWITVVQPE